MSALLMRRATAHSGKSYLFRHDRFCVRPSQLEKSLTVVVGYRLRLRLRNVDGSVANKLIYSNVALFDPGTGKRFVYGRHHSGRPGNVVNGSLQIR